MLWSAAGKGNGMAAGRDVYVMAFLMELGVPLESMARLEGGVDGWKASGRPLLIPTGPDVDVVSDFGVLLSQHGIKEATREALASLSLEACVRALHESRVTLLNLLKERGLGLAERQAVVNALSKAVREGRVNV